MNRMTVPINWRRLGLALLLAAFCAHGAGRQATVTATGRGDTFKEAKQAARRKAIAEVGEKYLRLQHSWRTPEERAVVVESLLTVSDSFVKSFRVLERKDRQDETWIRAKVTIDIKTLKAAISLISASDESGGRRRHRLPKPPPPPPPGTNVPPPKNGFRPEIPPPGGGNPARPGNQPSDHPEVNHNPARPGNQPTDVKPPAPRPKPPRPPRRRRPSSQGLEIEPLDF